MTEFIVEFNEEDFSVEYRDDQWVLTLHDPVTGFPINLVTDFPDQAVPNEHFAKWAKEVSKFLTTKLRENVTEYEDG